MPTPLRPDGRPVRVSDVELRTPGLRGEADVYAAQTGSRAARSKSPAFQSALTDAGFTPVRTIELRDTREVPIPPGGTRAVTPYAEDALVVEVPSPNESFEQVVLMQDEAGVLTWGFAVPDANGGASATRGTARRRYTLRRYVPRAPGSGEKRGLLGAVGVKIIQVLAFPIQRAAGGAIVSMIGAWERNNRPYGLARVDAGSYAAPITGAPDEAAWRELARGPVLLLVHGTFSRCHSTFTQLPSELIAKLVDAYERRVLAFDHPTVSVTPRANADWLLRAIPDGLPLTFDVVAHSRGGLVARILAERLADLDVRRDVVVRRAVLAGVPDNGTALTASAHIADFLDAFSNLLNFFPDAVGMDALQCVLAAVKEVAIGALDRLTGLQSMLPQSEFQQWLNAGPKTTSRYHAVASSFAPAQSGLKEWAEQRLMRAIFREDNDLVVPTASVYAANGSGYFPIADDDVVLFGTDTAVNHCQYFLQARVREKLAEWLGVV